MPGNAEKHGQLTRAEGEMGLGRAGKISQDSFLHLEKHEKLKLGVLRNPSHPSPISPKSSHVTKEWDTTKHGKKHLREQEGGPGRGRTPARFSR